MRVMLESPYRGKTAGEMATYLLYARRAMLDSLQRGECPFASHLLYTQVLDDARPEERDLGIRAGYEWHAGAELMVVYTDYGHSPGMEAAAREWVRQRKNVAYREIGRNP